MMKRILSTAPHKVDIWHETCDGETAIETRYDVEPVLDQTKLDLDMGLATERKGTYRKIANIPQDVLDRAFRDGWFHDPKAWKRWVNDPVNRDFKVFHGTY